MVKKVLITGSNGFVGNHIMKALIEKNVEIISIIRKDKASGFQENANLTIVESPDIFNETEHWWKEKCEGVDLIIHAAWYAEPGKYLQSSLNADCLTGSVNLAKGAAAAGVKRFVGIGTCFEYDLTQGVLTVDTALKPHTPYAAAKASLFLFLSQWLPTLSMEFTWCRLFYLFGEGEDERRLVPYIHKQLQNGKPAELTTGRQIRDFLDVAEAAKKIVEVSLGKQTGPVNICSGTPITVRQLAEQIASTYGRPDLLHFGARPDNLVDPPCVVGVPNIVEIKI